MLLEVLISCSKHFWFEQCFNGKYQFLIFVIFYHKNTEVPNRKFLTFFPFGRILKHDLYFHFNPVNNEEKNWNWAANFASPTMLQSVAWLSFSIFGRSLTIENWKLQSIFNFCFRPKHCKSSTEPPKREGEGSIHVVIFLSLTPSTQIPFPPCEFFFFCSCPPPSPSTVHFSGTKEARNSYLPRSHFSKHERLQCWE